MAGWDVGSAPITSTQGIASDPSTATLIAEIQSLRNVPYEARIVCGASTLATFHIEHCLSTGLGSTALRTSTNAGHMGRRTVFTQTNASAQYVLRFKAETDDLLRVRVNSTFTGDAAATIQLERLS